MLLIVTLLSAALAAVMSGVAWRVARAEQRRANARIAALAADIHDERAALTTPRAAIDDLPAASSPLSFLTMAATGALVVGAAAALAVVLGAGARTSPAAPIAEATTTAGVARPLELVALSHDRDGDRLTVRGVIHNPAGGTLMERLTAIVFVFDHDGRFVTSSRAAVETPSLEPGGKSAFVVAVPNASDVSHYRVSFRRDDRVVPHVDARDLSARVRVP